MLSRVAETIYWLSRYVERAENTARLLWVNNQLMLDTPRGVTPGWEPLVYIIGLDQEFVASGSEPTERNVVKFLIGNEGNRGSILSSLAAARENFRTVREILPRSGWELLNELHIHAREHLQQGVSKKGRDTYLNEIITGSQRLVGLFGSVLYRDEAFHFMRVGRNLERADMTTRIVDVRSTDLFEEEEFESRSLDALQWISVLKSLSGYQSFRRHKQNRVGRAPALEFLFRDDAFPRSVAHCLNAVEESVGDFKNNHLTLRKLRSVMRKLGHVDAEAISQDALHELIDELQIGIHEVHEVLVKTYFQAGGPTVRVSS